MIISTFKDLSNDKIGYTLIDFSGKKLFYPVKI